MLIMSILRLYLCLTKPGAGALRSVKWDQFMNCIARNCVYDQVGGVLT